MYYTILENYQTNTFWRVKRDPVYRLLDNSQYLDDFFKHGQVMLSCFSKFRKYPDEFQGDPREGGALGYFVLENGTSIGLKYEAGSDAYVMSTTTECSTQIIQDFKAVGAIKILDTVAFTYELAQCIKHFASGVEGTCIYDDSRAFHLRDDKTLSSLYKGTESVHDPEFMHTFRIIAADREMFLKHTKYKYQREYRLIWYVRNSVEQSLVVKCPALIELCERIDF